MAAIAQLQATKQPPIPFKAVLHYEEYPTTRLVHQFNLPPLPALVANQANAAAAAAAPTAAAAAPVAAALIPTTILKKQDTTFCPDSSDKERLICVIEDYIDAAGAPNLDLHDTDLHKKARNVFGGNLKHSWDSVITGNANLLDKDFNANIRTFLGMFLPSNAFLIQQEYMLHATKPFHMDCFAAAGCLRLINVLSIHLPGSSGKNLFTDDTSMKNAFYCLMLPAWQLKFNKTGNQLDDKNYKFQRLVLFMEQQRLHHDAGQQFCQNRRKFNGNTMTRVQRPCYNAASPRTLFQNYRPNSNYRPNNSNYRPNTSNNYRSQYSQTNTRLTSSGNFHSGQRSSGSQTVSRPGSRPNSGRGSGSFNHPHGPPRYNTRYQQRCNMTNGNNRSDAHHLDLDSDMYYDNSNDHYNDNNFQDGQHDDNYYQECKNNGTSLTQEEDHDQQDNYYHDQQDNYYHDDQDECYHQNIYHEDNDSADL